MERVSTARLRIGAWCVDPMSGELSRNGETARLDVRTLRLLIYLADHAGEVVSIDDLLEHVWPDVIVTPASVYQAVTSLRRVLGDDPKQPTYVATVPRLGYRLLATVTPLTVPPMATDPTEPSPAETPAPIAESRGGARAKWAVAAVCVAVAVAFLLVEQIATTHRTASRGTPPPQAKSIAVLPFLDLTEKMAEEEFADGLTEEVIDRLNKIPGVRVPPPTSSFSFKNKRRSVADIARALNVAYVLDGSTRKSGDRLRVAARLIRPDSGVVIWSDSYDRAWGDTLTVQDDIAGEITKALKASIESGSQP
jgi:TolB-like protein/DNA-binding winged helix-turn-helix (wHTH) protein